MTKQELNRYFWLTHEISRQKKRLEKLREKKNGEVVGDTVRDYSTGKGLPLLIRGIPEEDFTRPVIISLLEEEITKNIEESEEAVVEIEKYIQSVENPKLRELLRCRYIDCMKWEEIGEQNYMAPDYVRALIRDHFKKEI